VQVLFAFLLTMPFTNRFEELSSFQRGLYVVDLSLAALAIVLLSGPVAHHRLLFRKHAKARILRASNIMAIAGLVVVALAVSSSVWLVVSFTEDGAAVGVVTGFIVAAFALIWFVTPFLYRGRDDY
jgi:hypothetical protein